MQFGLFSNGFRPHTTAQHTYDEDIREIVLADQLGMEMVFISEHHGEPPYINTVDTIPAPEMMMCKAAALTKRIRMGAAVNLIHLHHPLDVAVRTAVTDHLVGDNRFIFGFGSGFSQPLMCEERGLPFEHRHARLRESLDFIHKAWASDEPFDWDGEHWQGKGVIALPKPLAKPHMPMATATESEDMLQRAGENGYILLSSFHEDPEKLKIKAAKYAGYARAAGRENPLANIAAARAVYVANSKAEALADLRDAVTYEVGVQEQRGFLKVMKNLFGHDIPNGPTALEAMVEMGFYVIGTPDEVAEGLTDYWDRAGGFGTLLLVAGKDWATREKRERSLQRFMEEVAPQLRDLDPVDAAAPAARDAAE